MSRTGRFYALRYVEGTDIRDRKHSQTLGRWDTFGEADDARVLRPNADLLEVVVRGGES